MKLLSGKIACVCVLIGFSLGGFAQSLDQAKKLYDEGLYEDAKPAFERLVLQSPNNSQYSLWYGVCCYETGDLKNAEKYLLIAKNRKQLDSYRYLAAIYTSSYRFAEAAGVWEEYITEMTKKKVDTQPYAQQLERVEKLLRMKEKTEDVQIIDSIVVSKDQILSTYFLSEDCGTLLMYPDFFPSPGLSESTVYINPKGDQAYYAHPFSEGRYTLYTQSKLLETWTDEKAIFASDLSENNYPFVLGDGLTLYFSSKGNGSIGGYDLFVTRYNTNINAYLAPEQLGMPFNSTANDYMMVIDEAKGLGWFVSDRNQPEGKACVYLFIPNETRKFLAETGNDEWLIARATLNSIQDTWQPGADYDDQIRLAKTDLSFTEKKIIRDFEFLVNDKTVYYTLNEFRSQEAKTFYERVINLKQQATTLEINLFEKRQTYSQGNTTVRQQLQPSILQSEVELRRLLTQISEWEKKARNTENIQLRN
jgi:tetratricopeptide (TPR) repeat protein